MKNIIRISVYLICLYAFKAGATEYDTKVIGDMGCVKIHAIKVPMQSDSLVWLCVKGVYMMPKVNDSCSKAVFYYELKDSNLNSTTVISPQNITVEGGECDSLMNDRFYIFRKIAEQSNLQLVEL